MRQPFAPESFVVDPNVGQYQLDQEVASIIANSLYASDPEVYAGNDRVSSEVVVDPTGETSTIAVLFSDQLNPQHDSGYRVSFEADQADDVNQRFGAEMQAAFLDGERRNRTGLAGTLAMAGVIAGLFEGGTVAAATSTNLLLNDKIELIGIGTALTSWIMQTYPKHLYRLNVDRPGTYLNKRHLRAAAKMVDSLRLPPVVTAQ